MSLKGLRFTLEVDGGEPDTFAVVNFRLIQNQSYPFVMSVDVASDSFMQTAEMLLEKATLTIWQGVIPQRYVTGVVAGFGMQENNGWQMRYHLRIEPPLWRCGLRQNFRIFQQGYPDDIGHVTERERRRWTPLFYEDQAREFCLPGRTSTGRGRSRYVPVMTAHVRPSSVKSEECTRLGAARLVQP